MALAAGTHLGPYEILSPLGAGGMGEVYRAKDAKLDRFVAVKILPERLATDADALARFEREAKAVATLSHPNILSIHDFGREGAVAYAVTELLEGETLRARLEGGALAQRRAIEVAIQIARGLAAAHEKGIVHRDLKPENIFLTGDGRVKILDFGLAKILSREDAQTSAPTTPAGTEPGTVMGTVGYMSPEQVRGREVDQRTDLFSFGAILYEMLSGNRAFRGDSQVETMNAILKEEPPELTESGRNISPALDRIVRHCLEKSPEARFHSAGDVAFALESLSSSAVTAPGSRIAPPGSDRGKRLALSVAVLAAALGAGILLDRALRPPTPSPTFRRLTSRRGVVTAARFAAGGQTVVYSAQWEGNPAELFSVASAGGESRALAIHDAVLLSVSPSDELAVKLRPTLWAGHLRGTLARVPLSGGSPRELREEIQDADWGPDGRGLALVHLFSSTRWTIEYPEGKVLRDEGSPVNLFRVSPGGNRIAAAEGWYPWWPPELVVLDRSGRRNVVARETVSGLAWDRSRRLWFTSPDPGGATTLAALRPPGKQESILRVAGTMALQDISPGGDFLANFVRAQSSAMYRAPGTAREIDLAWHENSEIADISPDGQTVLLNEPAGDSQVPAYYLRKTDGSPAIRLGEGIAQVFSPDGKSVLARPPNSPKTLLRVPIGAGEPKAIPVPIDLSQWWFFPDGKRILVSGLLPTQKTRIYSIDLDGKDYRQIAPDDYDAWVGEKAISPDGRFIVLQGSESNVALFPAGGGAPRPPRGWQAGDVVIRWSDEHSLFVFKRNDLPARVFRLDIETGKRTPWLELMPADPAGVTRIPTIAMTADGKSCAYNFTRELSDLYLIRGLK